MRGGSQPALSFAGAVAASGGESMSMHESTLWMVWQSIFAVAPAVALPQATGGFPMTSTPVARSNPKSEKKLHHCPVPNCNATFTKPGNLRRHALLHNGHRPWKCPELLDDGMPCGRAFARRADLDAHTRIHSGERPFECHLCHKLFSRNSDWRNHMKNAHGVEPYRCCELDCNYRFQTMREMREHMQLLHPGFEETLQVPSPPPARLLCGGHMETTLQVVHEGHVDYLIDGELHHWTDDGFCENHGVFQGLESSGMISIHAPI